MKRFFLFAITNMLVIATITIIMNVFGLNGYLTAQGIDYKSLMIICLLWGSVGSIISLLMSKFMAKRSMGLQEIDPNDPNLGWVVRSAHQYAKTAGIDKMPEVFLYNSPEVNAFATGPSKNNSLVAVSAGLLNTMSKEEAEGVIGHEVAHIANGDMVTMALLQGVMNAFVMFLSRIVAFAISNAMRGENDRRSSGGGFMNFAIIMVLQSLFGFLAMFVISYFSRYREYRADIGGAKYAGRQKMIDALKKLQAGHGQVAQAKDNGSLAAFKISGGGGIMAMLSTHPPLSKRIEALEMSRV